MTANILVKGMDMVSQWFWVGMLFALTVFEWGLAKLRVAWRQGVRLTSGNSEELQYVIEKSDAEQLLQEMGRQSSLTAQQQLAAALAAVSHIRPVRRLGAGACGEIYECAMELPTSAAGATPGSIAVAVKAVSFTHHVSTNDSTSSSARGLGPSCLRVIDINTPLTVMHELSANQAVAGSPYFAALLGYRLSMSGALMFFEVVGSGTTLSRAVYQQQQQEPSSSMTSPSALKASTPPAAGADGSATLPPLLLDHLVRFVVASIHTLHTAGWVHLDLKPDNMLLTGRLQPKMADLGTAYQMGTLVGGVGTPLFWAPQMDSGTRIPAHPALDYRSAAITIINLIYRADLARTCAAARLAASMAATSAPLADQAAVQLWQLLLGDGMCAELVELRMVLLRHCLAVVASSGGAAPLVDPQLADLDPFEVVQQYLAAKGIPELTADQEPLPPAALQQLQALQSKSSPAPLFHHALEKDPIHTNPTFLTTSKLGALGLAMPAAAATTAAAAAAAVTACAATSASSSSSSSSKGDQVGGSEGGQLTAEGGSKGSRRLTVMGSPQGSGGDAMGGSNGRREGAEGGSNGRREGAEGGSKSRDVGRVLLGALVKGGRSAVRLGRNIKGSIGRGLQRVLSKRSEGLGATDAGTCNANAGQQLVGSSKMQDSSSSSRGTALAAPRKSSTGGSSSSSGGGAIGAMASRRGSQGLRSSSGGGWGSARPSAGGALAEDGAALVTPSVTGSDGSDKDVKGSDISGSSSSSGGSIDDTQSAAGDDMQVTTSAEVQVVVSLLPQKHSVTAVTGAPKVTAASRQVKTVTSYKDRHVVVRAGHKVAKRWRQVWGKVL